MLLTIHVGNVTVSLDGMKTDVGTAETASTVSDSTERSVADSDIGLTDI